MKLGLHQKHTGDIRPCAYCEVPMTGLIHKSGITYPDTMVTRDHIHPKKLGGGDIALVCQKCNAEKKDMQPIKWLCYLIKNDIQRAVITMNTFRARGYDDDVDMVMRQ